MRRVVNNLQIGISSSRGLGVHAAGGSLQLGQPPMKAGLRSRLARDPWVASCACRSSRRPLRRDRRQLGAPSQAAQREGIRSLRGNWGDTRATRGRFWSAFGRGDGVGGAATVRGALLRDARRPDAARFCAQQENEKQLINRAPRRRPHSRRPPPHACPALPSRRAGSPRPNPWKRCRSTAAAAGSSAGRRGSQRAPR